MNQNFLSKFKYNITHWYQPIYCLKSNNVFAYEALLRDTSKLQVSPPEIFVEADKIGHKNTLDFISIKIALEAFKNESSPLFINVYPSTLLKKDFMHWWDTHIPPIIPVVLELLENESVINWEELKTVTKKLNSRGVKIAVDDMGSGYSSFQQFIELEPDYIKLDKYFAEGLSTNNQKQKVVKSLVDLVSDRTKIIIEGIEKEEDLNVAKLLGVPYAQGYLLGRPSPR